MLQKTENIDEHVIAVVNKLRQIMGRDLLSFVDGQIFTKERNITFLAFVLQVTTDNYLTSLEK